MPFGRLWIDMSTSNRLFIPCLSLTLLLLPVLCRAQWVRHTIDSGPRGADGVRLADVNSDGLPDMTTGWEEEGEVRVYLHPGHSSVRSPWPRVVAGRVAAPEDAVFVDVDGNGRMDVISACESRTRTLFVHWAPSAYLEGSRWRTDPIPASAGREMWMFVLPLSNRPLQLVAGSKGKDATISLLSAPAPTRNLESLAIRTLYQAGWIMSLRRVDMDGDGDQDVLASDRRGPRSGVLWLENPGGGTHWKEHRIGADGAEVLFLDLRAEADSLQIAVSSKPHTLHFFTSRRSPPHDWQRRTSILEAEAGRAKAVRLTDVDLDGSTDLVVACEGAEGDLPGVFWIPASQLREPVIGKIRDISGPEGLKFDRIEAFDLDGDGDRDIITCEERDNLGVIWYENPTR